MKRFEVETIELKPCPFCGGKAGIYSLAKYEKEAYCENCGAVSDIYETSQKAIEAWNRRAGDEKKCISCAYCDIDEGMCYRDPNHTGRGMYTLLDTSCSWWEERL